jgi:WhiB family transcriptional regulator, redox-sensing transcriptional regulator
MGELPELEDLVAAVKAEARSNDPIEQLSAAARIRDDIDELAEALLDHFVEHAREVGCSWSRIGTALGVSKQAAQQRHTATRSVARRVSRGVLDPPMGWIGSRSGGVLLSHRRHQEVSAVADTSRLPRPVADQWDWQLHGACRDVDSDVFFHPDAERGHARAARIERAKAICRTCPVLVQCRHHALTTEEPFGIWGGLDEAERRAAVARRRHLVAA